MKYCFLTKLTVLALFLAPNHSQASSKTQRQKLVSELSSFSGESYNSEHYPSTRSSHPIQQRLEKLQQSYIDGLKSDNGSPLNLSELKASISDPIPLNTNRMLSQASQPKDKKSQNHLASCSNQGLNSFHSIAAKSDPNPGDCAFTKTLGTYLAKGWKPDFSKNIKNSAFLQDQFDKRFNKGGIVKNFEALGLGPKTKIIIQDAIQLYMDYYNAYFNAQSEGRFTQPELNRYLMYINFYRMYLEGLLAKIPEILTARSKDLILSPGLKYEQTRHEDIVDKFYIFQSELFRNYEKDIFDSKSDEKKKNEGMGTFDAFNGLILPFTKRVSEAFKMEWDGKEATVGQGIKFEYLNKQDYWNGDDNLSRALGIYLKKGWNPDFTKNTKNSMWINKAISSHDHNGAFIADMEGLGVGPKTRGLMVEISEAYVNYFHAYYNVQQDSTLTEPEINRYLSYTNFYRLNLENLIDKMDDILTARSKDITQSSKLPFVQTRHAEILNKVQRQWNQAYKDLYGALNDPKSDQKSKNEAMGIIDAYNGLSTPMWKRVYDTFQSEWENKMVSVGKSIPQEILSKPDNYKPDAPKAASLGVYIRDGWTPNFEPNTKNQAAINEAVLRVTHKGNLISEIEGLGAGVKTKQLVTEAIYVFTNYINAYYNFEYEPVSTDIDQSRNKMYINIPRQFVDTFFQKINEILTARSKDLTLSPDAKFEKTRHQDVLESFNFGLSEQAQRQNQILTDPKSTEKAKNEAQGAIDAFNGIVKPFIEKMNQVFKEEWDTKQATVGKALNLEILKQPDNFGQENYQGAQLGMYLKKGWVPDFGKNSTAPTWIQDSISKQTHQGKLQSEIDGLGLGPKTNDLVQEIIKSYTDYLNAYYNSQCDQSFAEPEKNKYMMYINYYRLYLEAFIGKLPEIFSARSKDLTLSPNARYEDTRHQDIVEKFINGQTAWIKNYEKTLVEPKSLDQQKNEAMGAVDSYYGLVIPFSQKISEVFRYEWNEKLSSVGKSLNPETLKRPDNWKSEDSSSPQLGIYLKKGWKPDFTTNQKTVSFINQQIAKVTHNGKFETEMESLGTGPKTAQLIKEMIQQYTQYLNAYYNTEQDETLGETEKNRYLQYSQFFNLYLEGLLNKMNEILTARSKDLTLNPNLLYLETRHQDILQKFNQTQTAWSKKIETTIGDPNSSEKQQNDAMGTFDAFQGLVLPFSNKVDDVFRSEWELKLSVIGKGLTQDFLKQPDNLSGGILDNSISPALGIFLKKGWAPDFTVNQKNLALVTDAVNKQTRKGSLITELEGLGLSAKSKTLVTEIITTYTNYYNAYFNALSSEQITEPEKFRYLMYINYYRMFLEDLLSKITSVITLRSKDLTLSSDSSFEQTRHEDILDKLKISHTTLTKRYETLISDPKSSDIERNEAMGAVDSFSSLITPFINKVNEVFKTEWESKSFTIGKSVSPELLTKPDNWNGQPQGAAPVAEIYLKSDWKPDFTPNVKNAPQVSEIVSKTTHYGQIGVELERQGLGDLTRSLIKEIVSGYKQYINAAFNADEDSRLSSAERPKYQMYLNFERTYLESLLLKMNETLIARSKDLTLNSNFKFEQTRHLDQLEKFNSNQAEWVKGYQATLANPKSSEREKLEAQGAYDAYYGLILPFSKKVVEKFKIEWDGKMSQIGRGISQEDLQKPDNWNGSDYGCGEA